MQRLRAQSALSGDLCFVAAPTQSGSQPPVTSALKKSSSPGFCRNQDTCTHIHTHIHQYNKSKSESIKYSYHYKHFSQLSALSLGVL